MRTQYGRSRSSSATRLRAPPGPWWRIPKIETVTGQPDVQAVELMSSGGLSTGLVEVLPAVALLHHGLEVLAPDDRVLDRVADDGAGQPGRDIASGQPSGPEMRRQRQPLVDDRDRL